MKSFRLCLLEKLIYDWGKEECSIALHYMNDKLYINALTKNNHQIVLTGHHSLIRTFENYPTISKILSKYTLKFTYKEGMFFGEIYYYELARTYQKKLLKVKGENTIERLLSNLESFSKEEFNTLEKNLQEHHNDVLEIYGEVENLQACYLDKTTNLWNGREAFLKNFTKLFPSIASNIKEGNSLYLSYIEKTKMYEIVLKEKKIVSVSLLELLCALENSLKEEKEYKLLKK